MSAQHTPGPWTWLRNDACAGAALKGCYVRGGGVELAMVEARPVASQSVCEANARLIAAAPELLAALEAIYAEVAGGSKPYSGDSYLPPHLVDAITAAIAKATGSTS